MSIEANDICRLRKYQSGRKFVTNASIIEYDISAANVSVLADRGILSEQDRELLMELPKLDREISIGNKIKNKILKYEDIKDGIAEAKYQFMKFNNFKNEDILYVDNDAIGIIGRYSANILQVGKYTSFRMDSRWTSYCRLKNSIELFYFYNRYENKENFKAKGLGGSHFVHLDYMISFFKELFYTIQIKGYKDAISLLENFYKKYINRELEIGFYREFNSAGRYAMDIYSVSNAKYYCDMLSQYHINNIDISYNEGILRELMGYLYEEIFKCTKY